ncbi:MAG: energy transducer TonB [Deltaproteobacteria bacterium]
MRRLAPLLVLAAACAHAPVAEDPEVAAFETHRAEAAEGQTAPVRKSCRGQGPRLPQGETIEGVVHATYLVGADGRVSDVKVTGRASPAALKAIGRYVASCTYKPALRDGKPVAVRWRGDLDFTRARERR